MGYTTNERVVFWARAHVGQQVGGGECWDLADQALKIAGAASSAQLGPIGHKADYVWGTPIQLHEVRPGDILQFRDFVVTTVTKVTVTFVDGSGRYTDTIEEKRPRGHHTAVVDAVVGPGQLEILEQHVKPLGKKVQRHLLFTENQEGLPKTSHKMMKTGVGKVRPAEVVETTIAKVTGTIWAYRPMPL